MQPQVNSEKRRPRVPLSPEELFYFIQLKKLRKTEQVLAFKATRYYKGLNSVNITIVVFISYIVLSAFFLCSWQKKYILDFKTMGQYNDAAARREITNMSIRTTSGELFELSTSNLYELPRKFDAVWVGRDFLFGKILKGKLQGHPNGYLHVNLYPVFFISFFVLLVVFMVYHVNLHLTRYGLTAITTLLGLAFVYVICA